MTHMTERAAPSTASLVLTKAFYEGNSTCAADDADRGAAVGVARSAEHRHAVVEKSHNARLAAEGGEGCLQALHGVVADAVFGVEAFGPPNKAAPAHTAASGLKVPLMKCGLAVCEHLPTLAVLW